MSNGADGVTKMWKRSIMGGEWLLFSDQAIDLDEESDDEMLVMRPLAREVAREVAAYEDDSSDKENKPAHSR